MNQQYENVTESGTEPETFPLLEGRSTIRAIWVQFSDSHIPALYSLVLHPTLRTADLKDEIIILLHGINLNFTRTNLQPSFLRDEKNKKKLFSL